MPLFDDLFNMRRQFYEESREKWEKSKSEKKLHCPQCGHEITSSTEQCENCGSRLIAR